MRRLIPKSDPLSHRAKAVAKQTEEKRRTQTSSLRQIPGSATSATVRPSNHDFLLSAFRTHLLQCPTGIDDEVGSGRGAADLTEKKEDVIGDIRG